MNSATRNILFFGVLLALPISSWFFYFNVENQKIEKAKEEIAHKRKVLGELREATAKTDDLVKVNEEIREAINSIEARLPTGKEMDEVLRQVSKLAEKNGLRVPAFKKSDKSAPAGLALEQPITIEITGDFDGFYQFLLDLEQLPRITRVPDLTITRSDKVDGEMVAKMTLSIYYQGDETSLTSAQ